MVSAFILINTEIGSEQKVLEKLKTIAGVQEAHKLNSIYDIAAKVYAESIDQLRETITRGIKKIPNTTNFLTLLTVEVQKQPSRLPGPLETQANNAIIVQPI